MMENSILLNHLIQESYQELQRRYESNGSNTELPTVELVELETSSAFHFFEKGGVYELSGATPKANRDFLMQMSIANIAEYKTKKNVLLFFRKTNAQAWVIELLSFTSGVPMGKMNEGNFNSNDWRALAESTGNLAELGVVIYESDSSLDEFTAYCNTLHEGESCFDIIVIDGLSQKETNELEEGGAVRSALFALAKGSQAAVLIATATYRNLPKPKLRRVLEC